MELWLLIQVETECRKPEAIVKYPTIYWNFVLFKVFRDFRVFRVSRCSEMEATGKQTHHGVGFVYSTNHIQFRVHFQSSSKNMSQKCLKCFEVKNSFLALYSQIVSCKLGALWLLRCTYVQEHTLHYCFANCTYRIIRWKMWFSHNVMSRNNWRKYWLTDRSQNELDFWGVSNFVGLRLTALIRAAGS